MVDILAEHTSAQRGGFQAIDLMGPCPIWGCQRCAQHDLGLHRIMVADVHAQHTQHISVSTAVDLI